MPFIFGSIFNISEFNFSFLKSFDPIILQILIKQSITDDPKKIYLFVKSSMNVHPNAHTSTKWLYF